MLSRLFFPLRSAAGRKRLCDIKYYSVTGGEVFYTDKGDDSETRGSVPRIASNTFIAGNRNADRLPINTWVVCVSCLFFPPFFPVVSKHGSTGPLTRNPHQLPSATERYLWDTDEDQDPRKRPARRLVPAYLAEAVPLI